MRNYVLHRCPDGRPPLSGEVDGTAWALAEVATVDNFPWYKAGQKQATQVRLLYDSEAIYAQFICEDRHIYSRTTKVNGSVCKDSCVELFATTDPQNGAGYFNFEVNCCRVVHLGYGRGRRRRKLLAPSLAPRIAMESSISTPTRTESSDDAGWWLAAAIPLTLLAEFTGRVVAPREGTVWCGNFFRCGGKTDDQYACWNWVGTRKPDFHRPEFFGQLCFA